MGFPRYPAYKDSGVEWLGEVPEHWAVDRLKASITSARNGIWGNEAQGDDNDIPCVRVADFDRVALRAVLDEPTIRNVTTKEREGRILEPGNLLLEKSGGGENQPVGCVVLYDLPHPAVCSNFVARVQLKDEMDSSFWRYVHAVAYAVRLTVGSINQTSGIQNLDQDRYFNERGPFPPLAEQVAIATFLDRETAKIDALVAEQERLIALLKEKRQAVISHAVTKGLDPSVPMKDSGVAWLGEVPAHWSIQPIKRVARLTTGLTPPTVDIGHYSNSEDDFPWVRPEDLDESGRPSTASKFLSPSGASLCRQVEPMSTLICCIGTIGKVGISTTSIATNQQITAAEFEGEARYYFWQSCAARSEFELSSTGNVLRILNTERLGRIEFAIPPLSEQGAIAASLDHETAKLDALVEHAITTVGILQERRSALISAAVTGQIDVRALAGGAAAAAAAQPAGAQAQPPARLSNW